MLQRRISLAAIVLLLFSIAGFYFVELTTPARIGAIALFIMVGSYTWLYNRADVAASCAVFFTIFSINRYLFDTILPIWLSVVAGALAIFIIWYLLFGREGWIFAVTATLLVVELLLALQFINLEPRFQSFLTVMPFMVICQYYYFDHYGVPEMLSNLDE